MTKRGLQTLPTLDFSTLRFEPHPLCDAAFTGLSSSADPWLIAEAGFEHSSSTLRKRGESVCGKGGK